MAFVRNDGVKGESSLILADPSGAHETHLATRRIGNDIGPFDLPSWAPDGRTITVSVADPASDGLYIHLLNVSVRDGSATSFSPVHWRSLNDTRWLPDGSGMLIAAQERSGAPQQIYWNAEGSGEVRKITGDVNSYLSLSVGSDSRSFLAVQSDINVNVWVGLPGTTPMPPCKSPPEEWTASAVSLGPPTAALSIKETSGTAIKSGWSMPTAPRPTK